MSQPPPGFPNQPPPGFPGQPGAPYMPPQPPRTNGWAIASLICGLLGCFPVFITGLLAIVFGVLGIGKAKQPQTGGKGLAIAGLVLGVLGLLWSVGFIGLSVWGYHTAQTLVLEPTKAATSGFVNSLVDGDIEKARTYTTGALEQSDLSSLAQQVKSYGKFKDFTFKGMNADKSGQTMTFTIHGTAAFENATKEMTATLSGDPKSGTGFKISDLKFE